MITFLILSYCTSISLHLSAMVRQKSLSNHFLFHHLRPLVNFVLNLLLLTSKILLHICLKVLFSLKLIFHISDFNAVLQSFMFLNCVGRMILEGTWLDVDYDTFALVDYLTNASLYLIAINSQNFRKMSILRFFEAIFHFRNKDIHDS